MEYHPKAEQLEGFLEGRSEGLQARVLITHLLRGCPQCAAEVSECLRPSRDLPPSAYDKAFEKALVTLQARPAAPPLSPRLHPGLVLRRGVLSLPGSPI
jgi:hypothetical protein